MQGARRNNIAGEIGEDGTWELRCEKRAIFRFYKYLIIKGHSGPFLRSLLGKTHSLLGKNCSLLVFPSSLLRNGGIFKREILLPSKAIKPIVNFSYSK